MNLTFAANLTKMIDAGLGREAAPPETFVAVGRTTEYSDLGPVPIASFETNVEAPLRALSVAMEPIQAGTGDPSPENVRPITGRTAVTATRAGKNLLTRTGETHAYLDSTGNIREYASGWLLSDYIRVAPSTQYTFNPNSTAGGSAKSWYFDANKNGISYIDSGESTFTTPDNCSFMRFSYREASTNVQLELGSIATPYEPYNGQTVTLQLGQTVYGGTLDVVAGKLYSEWANIASYDGEELPGEWISSMDVYSEGATPTTGAQVCYKLAEPVEIILTPEQITTLIGVNNVWSDGGDVSLTYGTTRYTEGY